MSDWVWVAVAAVVVGAAAWIIARRVTRFVQTGGQSACDDCPYSGECGGNCKNGPPPA